MTTQITVQRDSAVAVPEENLAELQATTVSIYRSIERDDGGFETLPSLPSDSLRKRMQGRCRALQSLVRPIATSMVDRDRVTAALGRFYSGYPNLKVDNPAMMVAAWTAKLEDYSAVAIEAACFDFENGEVFDDVDGVRVPFSLDYPPTFPRFKSVVAEKQNRLLAEQGMMRRILMIRHVRGGAAVERNERVGLLLSSLAHDMKVGGGQFAVQVQFRAEERERIRQQAREAYERSERILREAAQRRALAT